MITQCPSCKKTISVSQTGLQACPKCRASIIIGNPLKDEDNKLVAPPLPDGKVVKPAVKEQKKKVKPTKKGSGIPWDNMSAIGFTEATIATSRLIFFTPTKFFRALARGKDNRFIPLYGVMMAIVGTLFKFFWILKFFRANFSTYEIFVTELKKYPEIHAGVMQMTEKSEDLQRIYNVLHAPAPVDLLFAVLLAPIAAIVIHALALFLASTLLGSRTKLQYYYRVAGFSQVTALFNIIPFFGMIIAFFWQMVLFFKSLEVVRGFTKRKAVMAMVIYIVISSFFSFFSFGG